ncbi:MAG: outer membrane beta-barrel protein [Acidobacteriaceae bacterium]
MRNFIGFALLFGMLSLAAAAQESAPKGEFFGGYQYTKYDGGTNANGWDTAVTGNLNRWLGVTGDFSGAYNSQNGVSFHDYLYTVGPVVSLRTNKAFTPYAHFLAGGSRASFSGLGLTGSNSGFAMMFGGGVDIAATRHVAIRAAQLDWLSLRSNGVSDNNNLRITTGLVFRY